MDAAGRRVSDSQAHPGTPYVGPRPFQWPDASRFFGRGREARDVRALWSRHRLVVLHGRAGTGKSSLLNAGILPLLRDQGDIDLLLAGTIVSQSAAYDGTDNAYRYSLLNSWAPVGEPPDPDLTIADFLTARSCIDGADGLPGQVLAAIDQFEEVFAALPSYDRQCERLIEELAQALRDMPALRLLIIMRDDHLATFGRCQRGLSSFQPVYYRLDALSPQFALEAIRAPLAGTGRSFGAGVAENLVEQLRTHRYTDRLRRTVTVQNEVVEPLDLQLACTNLWNSLPDDVSVITDDNLRAFGDTDQAVAEFFDAAILKIIEPAKRAGVSETELRDWIEDTFITERGTRGTALRGITTTAGMPNSVADSLVRQLVLTPEFRNNSTWYQLSQDRLIAAIRHANGAWRSTHGARTREPVGARTAAGYRSAAEAAFGAGDFVTAQRYISLAIDCFRRAGHARDLALAFEFKGEITRAHGDLAVAEQSLREALTEFSILGDAVAQASTLSALGDVYSALGDYVKAVQFHQQASERLPADVDALTGLGYAQWLWGSPADAEATFTKALNWDHDKREALVGRGQARVDLREYPAALADLDHAIRLGLPPDSEIDARSARAVALADLGQEDEAAKEIKAARSGDPGRPRTRFRAARVDAAFGRLERARSELMEALQARPPLSPVDQDGARQLLDRLARMA